MVGTLFGAYASGLSTLTEDEKQIGATVIDMGGGTTSIAVFLEGHLVHADVVPMGGFAVTNDIARMLAAPLGAAERTKTLYGAAMGDMDGGADVVSVAQMGEEGDDAALRVPRSMLTRIIQARLEEIFGEVQTRLRARGFGRGGRPPPGPDRRRLPAGRHPRTGGAHPEQAGPHRPAGGLCRPCRRQ